VIILGLSHTEVHNAVACLGIVLTAQIAGLQISRKITDKGRKRRIDERISENSLNSRGIFDQEERSNTHKRWRGDLWKDHAVYLFAVSIQVLTLGTKHCIYFLHVHNTEGAFYQVRKRSERFWRWWRRAQRISSVRAKRAIEVR